MTLNNIILETAVRDYLMELVEVKDFIYLRDAHTNEFFIRAVNKELSQFTNLFGGYASMFDFEYQNINAGVEKLKKILSDFLKKVPYFDIILKEPLHGDLLSRHEGEVSVILKDEYKDKLDEVAGLLRIQNILTGEVF